MERGRQFVGEMLLHCFVVALLTGGYLAWFLVPGDGTVTYDGPYEPLQGVTMSAAYASMLELSFDVPGGPLALTLHRASAVLLVLGSAVWLVLGRFRHVPAWSCLGLALFAGLCHLTDLPAPVSYGLHLLAAVTMAVVLVTASRREAARRPRTVAFVAVSAGLVVLAFFAWL